MERFLRFLEGPGGRGDRLVLVGDLFDFWVSPHQVRDPALRPVLDALRGLSERGVDVGFVEGNRDFEASRALGRFGVRALPDVEVIEAPWGRVAVTHGDALCTRDVGYQAFRRVVRAPVFRHLLRRAPEGLVMGAGRQARAESRRSTARKPYGDMGLDPLAVTSLLRSKDADALVCGHVHWGRRYQVEVDGVLREVVVLSDWEERGSYAVVDETGLGFHVFE